MCAKKVFGIDLFWKLGNVKKTEGSAYGGHSHKNTIGCFIIDYNISALIHL